MTEFQDADDDMFQALPVCVFEILHTSSTLSPNRVSSLFLVEPQKFREWRKNWVHEYKLIKVVIISNYWMRLSRIWRILQIKEGVINRGRRPRWITSSEICRILHILWKPNSIIALLFIQNICPFLKEFRHFALKNNTISSSGFLGQRFNNLQRAALLTSFWRHRFNNFQQASLLTSLIRYDEESFQIWWTAAGYGELCVWF